MTRQDIAGLIMIRSQTSFCRVRRPSYIRQLRIGPASYRLSRQGESLVLSSAKYRSFDDRPLSGEIMCKSRCKGETRDDSVWVDRLQSVRHGAEPELARAT